MSKIIVIVGPTGVGKTKLSISLAKKYNAEIINADAVQVFKDFNIGTAKIREEEKENIKHHLIDFLNPNENYSVADYQKNARKVLDELIKENKNIIIVGGTGLYIKALLYDYNFLSSEIKDVNEFEELSNEELKEKVDNIYQDNNIHTNNRKRLVRFLNEYNLNNKIIKNEDNKENILYNNVSFIGLSTSREKLYDRVNKRVEEMFDEGLLEEAKKLSNINRSNLIIGYKELNKYFNKKITLEEAKEEIKKNTRHYVKRQYTWFKNQMNINWFDVDFNNFNNTISDVIDYLEKN